MVQFRLIIFFNIIDDWPKCYTSFVILLISCQFIDAVCKVDWTAYNVICDIVFKYFRHDPFQEYIEKTLWKYAPSSDYNGRLEPFSCITVLSDFVEQLVYGMVKFVFLMVDISAANHTISNSFWKAIKHVIWQWSCWGQAILHKSFYGVSHTLFAILFCKLLSAHLR